MHTGLCMQPIEIDEDVLNEELIDSLIEETREEELLENIQSVIKKYPRDNDWKKLVMKHKRHVDAFKKGKDMPKKVEDEFLSNKCPIMKSKLMMQMSLMSG